MRFRSGLHWPPVKWALVCVTQTKLERTSSSNNSKKKNNERIWLASVKESPRDRPEHLAGTESIHMSSISWHWKNSLIYHSIIGGERHGSRKNLQFDGEEGDEPWERAIPVQSQASSAERLAQERFGSGSVLFSGGCHLMRRHRYFIALLCDTPSWRHTGTAFNWSIH